MTWRSAPDAGWIALIVFALVLVLATLVLRCTPQKPPEPCIPTLPAAIVAECRVQYRQAGCATDPERLCPDLVRACDARIDGLTDAEVCGQ